MFVTSYTIVIGSHIDVCVRLKRFFGSTVKKTVDAAKSLAQEVSHARHKEDVADIVDEVRGEHNVKLKASNSHKGPYDFDGCVRYVQVTYILLHTHAHTCILKPTIG